MSTRRQLHPERTLRIIGLVLFFASLVLALVLWNWVAIAVGAVGAVLGIMCFAVAGDLQDPTE